MRNKFVALSTLVPMAFAISFSGADPVTDSQEFAELGKLIQDTQYSGQKTQEDSTKALEQFKKLESRYKDIVSDRNAIQANLKNKDEQLQQASSALAKEQKSHQKTQKQLQDTEASHKLKTDALTKQLSEQKRRADENEAKRKSFQAANDKTQAALDAKTREHEQITAQLKQI